MWWCNDEAHTRTRTHAHWRAWKIGWRGWELGYRSVLSLRDLLRRSLVQKWAMEGQWILNLCSSLSLVLRVLLLPFILLGRLQSSGIYSSQTEETTSYTHQRERENPSSLWRSYEVLIVLYIYEDVTSSKSYSGINSFLLLVYVASCITPSPWKF